MAKAKKTIQHTDGNKSEIIAKYQQKDGDTGSPIVQIALLSKRIYDVSEHLKTHKKDDSSRRGFLKLIGQRRRLVEYVKKNNVPMYTTIRKEFGI